MARRRLLPALAGTAVVFASAGAPALPIFVASGEGDWFDGASWSGGVAPAASDDPVIDNGATATASSASPLYPGAGTAVEVQSLAVGSRLDASQPADASGALEMTDVDLVLAGDLSIGVDSLSSPEVASSVSGTLSSTGGGSTPGNVSVGGSTSVGVVATGALAVDGDLETTESLGVALGVGVGRFASGQVAIGGELRVNAVDYAGGTGVATVNVARDGSFGFDTPTTPTTGSLSIAGDLKLVFGGEAVADAEVGNRTLIAEPTKMAVDASF